MSKCFFGILIVLFAFSTRPASAQAPVGKSPWCEKFDNKSEDHRLKATVIQTKKNGQVDNDLLSRFKLVDLLKKALNEINAAQTPDELMSTMTESFRVTDSDERNPRSHLAMTVSARPGEAQLKPSDMLGDSGNDSFKPVGFFNRFDLNSFPQGHCGEARIVYSKARDGGRRMLLIFEGKVSPKADETASVTEGECRPVAEFWASLIEATGASRAEMLRKFYFEGDMGTFGRLASAPMSFKNLGGSNRGQVRGDLFVNGEWQLREWLLRRHGDRLAFDMVTVKDNPLAEFYDAGKITSLLEKERGKTELQAFQKSFKDAMLATLVLDDVSLKGPAVAGLPADTRMFHSFGFGPGATSQYDEFQSTSQGDKDFFIPDTAFKNAIGSAVTAPKTADHVFARAMAVTCAGCHQPEGATAGDRRLQIAENTFWPRSLNFVHIDEDSVLSEALLNHFLPFRAAVMKDHLCKEITPAIAANTNLFSLRKEAPLFQAIAPLRDLNAIVSQSASQTERSIAQEAVNDQELARRRVERSEAGSVWQLRRTH